MSGSRIFDASARSLKLLALLVWSSGAVVLYIKSLGLLLEAENISPGHFWIWLAVLGGLMIGIIKARYLFRRLCLNNMKRIDALEKPRLWQFYRLRFFVFLVTMIVLGLFLSVQAHDNYPMLLGMAVVEISIATALLVSSNCFWRI